MFEKIVRPCITRCKAYVPGKPIEEVQRELGLTDIVKVASNENPFGCSPLAERAMIAEIKANANRYPESLCTDLVQKLAKLHQVNPNQIVVGNGLDSVLSMLGLLLVDPGDEVIMGELSFPSYENATTKMDGICVKVPMTEDGGLNLNGFLDAVTDRTKLMFVCNPNNPTGTMLSKAEVDAFVGKVPAKVIVALDEAYIDYVDSQDFPNSREYLDKYPNVLFLRTFSKVHGLAAFRVGYSVSHPEFASLLLKIREPFPVNRMAAVGAFHALDDHDFVAKTVRNNADGRRYFCKRFDENHIRYYHSSTNFICAEVSKPAVDVFNAMLRDGVIIRPLAGQGRPNWVRISIGRPEENERTMESLLAALK